MTGSESCFLCRKKLLITSIHTKIDGNVCQASRKTIKNVINHLAECSNMALHISKQEVLCFECYSLINDYDACLVSLLRKQKKLSLLIDKALMGFDETEVDCIDDMTIFQEFEEEPDTQQSFKIAYAEEKTFSNLDSRKNSSFIPLEPQCELLQCTLCAMRFRSKIRLHKHIANAHKKYSCELCNYSHRNEDYVKLHMNLHEGKSENQCRYCDKEFSTKISTMRHMEVHMNTKKYQCDKCGLCFSQTTVMYNHKLQHEAEEKPLRCDICEQVFKTKRTFRHHMITHRADRPRHRCEFCGKTFTEKYTLKVHKKSHHENESKIDTNQLSDVIEQKQHLNLIIANHDHQNSELSVNTQFDPTKINDSNGSDVYNIKDQLNKTMENVHDEILKSLSATPYNSYEVVSSDSKKSCNICGQLIMLSDLEYHLINVHSNE